MDTSRNGQVELTAGQKALRGLLLVEQQGLTTREAAEQVEGTSKRQIEALKGVLLRSPDLRPMIASGELSLNAAQVASGYRQDVRVPGGHVVFGKGDKWVEAVKPLIQYLAGWKTRGYEFKHLPPKEAERRVGVIDQLIESLQEARTDLVKRSVRAQTSIRSG